MAQPSSTPAKPRPLSLGVIAARGGSKGIPRKNIKRLLDKPLIAYTIESARQSQWLSRCIVSTEDSEIGDIASQWGGEVPFRRPAELATDEAQQIDVLIDATLRTEQEQGVKYDIVVVLQPTAPLRAPQDIDCALEMLISTQADSVISLAPARTHPYYMYGLENDRPVKLLAQQNSDSNRQGFPTAYVRNGAVYAVRREVLVGQRSLYGEDLRGFVMPAERSINIDSPLDWGFAEYLLHQRNRHDASL